MKISCQIFILVLIVSIILTACKKNESLNEDEVEKGLGLIPMHPDSLVLIPILDTTAFFSGRLMSPPSLALDMPPVDHQGGEGSCAAFATAYATRSFYYHENRNRPWVKDSNTFSPEFLYNSAKNSGTCDKAGMYINTALTYLKNFGVCTSGEMRYSYLNGCSQLPNLRQKANAEFFKIENFYRITDISENNLKQILVHKNPIIISVKLDSLFWDKGKFIWKSKQGTYKGNHALVICGYDDNKHAYKIMNSYGTTWGFDGFGWIDYDYLKEVLVGSPGRYEMFVIEVQDSPIKWTGNGVTHKYKNIDACIDCITSGGLNSLRLQGYNNLMASDAIVIDISPQPLPFVAGSSFNLCVPGFMEVHFNNHPGYNSCYSNPAPGTVTIDLINSIFKRVKGHFSGRCYDQLPATDSIYVTGSFNTDYH